MNFAKWFREQQKDAKAVINLTKLDVRDEPCLTLKGNNKYKVLITQNTFISNVCGIFVEDVNYVLMEAQNEETKT